MMETNEWTSAIVVPDNPWMIADLKGDAFLSQRARRYRTETGRLRARKMELAVRDARPGLEYLGMIGDVLAAVGARATRPAQSADAPTAAPLPLWNSLEVAQYLNVPLKTLSAWASRGKGPAYIKVGKYRRYRISDIEAYLGANRHTGRAW